MLAHDRNCLREARCTLEKAKPLALMHDAAAYLKTFTPLATILDEECPDDLRDAVFGGRQVIEWYRIHVCACSAARPCTLRGQVVT